MAQKVKTYQLDPKTHQTGYGYVTFPGGTGSASVAVTFPTVFAVAPKVIVGALGYKTTAGGVPTAITDFTGNYGAGSSIPFMYAVSITTTGFTAWCSSPVATFGASYGGFTWIAEQ